jgi:large subunit ribosomal protein L17
MRHRRTVAKLSRNASHRKAMLSNLATQVFEHKKIRTTQAKAKVIRSVVERLISFAKKGDLAARRHVLRTVRNKKVVKELFEKVAPTFADRNGGYTRIVKLGQRHGDAAELAYLELVGFEGVHKEKKEKAAKKEGTKKKGKEVTTEEVVEEKSEE